MSVTVLLEAQVKPESVNALKSLFKEILPDTRAYDGCRGITVYSNQDNSSNLVLVQHWDSPEHHQKYLAWRTETGVMDRIGAMLSGAPSIRYFEKVDA